MASPERGYIPEGAESFRAKKVYVGTNTTSPEGYRYIVPKNSQPEPPILRPIDHTSFAEAAHTIVADELGVPILEVSVVPDHSKGSNGHMIPGRYSGPVAAAHIDEGGGGHDERVIEYMGDSVSAMKNIANGIKARRKEDIHVVADHLQYEKHVITGSEVTTIIEVYNRKKQKFEQAKNKTSVFIISPEGHTKEIEAKVDNGYVELPSHATIFSARAHNDYEISAANDYKTNLSAQHDSDNFRVA